MTNPAPPVDDARELLHRVEEYARSPAVQARPSLHSLLTDIGEFLSRIPSEEATAEEIRDACRGYCGGGLTAVLANAGLRITRAPGAKT